MKYEKYKQKYLILKNSMKLKQLGGSNSKPQLYLFKANWCGHCKNFIPEWDKLKEDSNLNNKVEFITMDSEKNATEIKEWEIKGFPTLILKKGNDAIEYNDNRSYKDIVKFINKNIN